MSKHEDTVRLRHMLDAAKKALEFSHGQTRQSLGANEQLGFSLVHLLEIIGEAASKISEDTKKINRTIPWLQIVGMRNRLIHAYFDIDLDEVWKTIEEDLPPLIPQLEKILNP